MPEIFANPKLPNYFISADEVEVGKPARSYVPEYEDAKAVVFPNLKPDIDFDFWSRVDTDLYPGLKKMGSAFAEDDYRNDRTLERKLNEANVPEGLKSDIKRYTARFYDSIIPIYEQVFAGYSFSKRRATWRVTTTRNENMHFDTYREVFEGHFARMFVNVDTQPRIWQTSWPIQEVTRRKANDLDAGVLRDGSDSDVWKALNNSTFGATSKDWWDDQPRHVIYFNPGDVWIVDSRQIAHQIFYGRRAVSIDYVVERESMTDPDRHYLTIASNFRANALNQGGLLNQAAATL